MKNIPWAFAYLLISLSIIAPALPVHASPDAERYIVKFKEAQYEQAQSDFTRKSIKTKRRLNKRKILAAELDTQQLKELRLDPNILSIEKDPKRYLLAETIPYGVNLTQAVSLAEASVSSVKICIIDSGYDIHHEDLINAGITGDDGVGTFDSGNWYEDGQMHGTHVAGIIAAVGGNDLGIAGINDEGNLGIHVVKVFDDDAQWAYGSDLVAAIDQCVASGANVINLSLGGSAPSQLERDAFAAAYSNGILSFAAAGNDGSSNLFYPASYDSVVSVAAIDSSKTVAAFSQHNQQVELAAPGVDILSTMPGNTYEMQSGTSMAAPHAAGVATLIWNHYPECSAQQIRQALNASAEDLSTPGWDPHTGYGLIQAHAAFDALTLGCDGNDGPSGPPPVLITPLNNGVTVNNLSASEGDEQHFSIEAPTGSSLLVSLSNGNGDADLYIKHATAPSTLDYDCRSYNSGNDELCEITDTLDGPYYVMVKAYAEYSGVTLLSEFTESTPPPPENTISFSVVPKWKKGQAIAKLTWDSATTNKIDLYRDGTLLKRTKNDGKARDKLGTTPNVQYRYQVCEKKSNVCSEEVPVNF